MVVGLLLFIVLFGAGPFLLAKFHKTKITVKRLKIFCAAYDLLALLVLNSLFIQKSATYFPMATILMCNVISIVFAWASYRILKQHLKKARWLGAYLAAIPEEHYIQQESEMNTFTVDTETGEVVKEEPKSPPVSFPQPVKTCSIKKRRLSFSTILLIFVCAVFAFVLFEFSYYARNAEATKAELLEKIESLEEKVDKLENEKVKLVQKNATVVQEKADLQQQLEFKNDKSFELFANLYRIGFIVDGSKYYHRFDCDIYTAADEYWAHNVEYCVHLGYPPCPQCW